MHFLDQIPRDPQGNEKKACNFDCCPGGPCRSGIGCASREVVTRSYLEEKRNSLGEPKGSYLAGAASVSTSTDANGRLDLSALPEGADQICVTLRGGDTVVFNGCLTAIPKSGSRTIDVRGSRTISTTTWTYFGFFTWQEVQDWVEVKDTGSVPSKAPTREPLPDGGASQLFRLRLGLVARIGLPVLTVALTGFLPPSGGLADVEGPLSARGPP